MSKPSSAFASIADVMNAFNLGVFPVKGQPNKFYARAILKDGKRVFVDRRAVQNADGTTSWQWVMGREIKTAEAPAQGGIAVA